MDWCGRKIFWTQAAVENRYLILLTIFLIPFGCDEIRQYFWVCSSCFWWGSTEKTRKSAKRNKKFEEDFNAASRADFWKSRCSQFSEIRLVESIFRNQFLYLLSYFSLKLKQSMVIIYGQECIWTYRGRNPRYVHRKSDRRPAGHNCYKKDWISIIPWR